MKYAVTGANGYIGRHVIDELSRHGDEITAVDIQFDEKKDGINYVNASVLNDDKDIYEKLGKPDVCIHLAWRNGFVHNHLSHIEDLPHHVTFLKNMIDGGLKHIVVMGSMHEVGYWEGAIEENTPTNPESLYGIAKNSLRQTLNVITKGEDICVQWIRGYYILGDDARNHSVFTKLLEAAKEGKKTFPFTTGKNKYDFTTVEELAKQISDVARQTEVSGVINCCSGNPISLADRVEQFISDNKLDISLEYGAFPDRPYDSPEVWGDPEKICRVMNYFKLTEKK